MIEYNYLDILNVRQLDYIPVHFVKTTIRDTAFFLSGHKIIAWIKSKLHGRYAIVAYPSEHDQYKSSYIVAFEDHKELTYFILACPYLRSN